MENTLQGLRNSLHLVSNPRFKYWEFDIHESKDNILFLFHDDIIGINNSTEELKYMKFIDIKAAGIKNNINIPTLDEIVLELFPRSEKIIIEIKNIMSDKCRTKIIETVSSIPNCKIMITPNRFDVVFPSENRDYWHNEFNRNSIKLIMVGRHKVDMFKTSNTFLGKYLLNPKWFFGF
ncbi:MAG: hypothetical protein HOJ64_00175 [Euryarchaeota archaeon]|nr:hypothetical protein [Euryarchaeota archaeon]MBT6873959.1 hypothetical protein [Euryarchaeota archaeon]